MTTQTTVIKLTELQVILPTNEIVDFVDYYKNSTKQYPKTVSCKGVSYAVVRGNKVVQSANGQLEIYSSKKLAKQVSDFYNK